jgi:hypothetical protein
LHRMWVLGEMRTVLFLTLVALLAVLVGPFH